MPAALPEPLRDRGGLAMSAVRDTSGTRVDPGGEEIFEGSGTDLDEVRGGPSRDPRETSVGPATDQDRPGTRVGHHCDLRETRVGPVQDLGGARAVRDRILRRRALRGHLWRLGWRIHGSGADLDGGRPRSSRSWPRPRWSVSRPGGSASGPPCGPHTGRLPAQRPPEGPGQTERQRSLSYGVKTISVPGSQPLNSLSPGQKSRFSGETTRILRPVPLPLLRSGGTGCDVSPGHTPWRPYP